MTCQLDCAPMDNKCFQPDLDIEMASVEGADKMSVEKEKKCVNFEEQLPTKVVCSESVENDVPELTTIQTIKNDIKPSSGPCQPDLCKETNKNVQQIRSKNRSFDPLLNVRLIAFFCICVSLVFWSIIHFTLIQ